MKSDSYDFVFCLPSEGAIKLLVFVYFKFLISVNGVPHFSLAIPSILKSFKIRYVTVIYFHDARNASTFACVIRYMIIWAFITDYFVILYPYSCESLRSSWMTVNRSYFIVSRMIKKSIRCSKVASYYYHYHYYYYYYYLLVLFVLSGT